MILSLSPNDAPYALAVVRVELTFARRDWELSDRVVNWDWRRIMEETEVASEYHAAGRN